VLDRRGGESSIGVSRAKQGYGFLIKIEDGCPFGMNNI
jgi:hypothetical protein